MFEVEAAGRLILGVDHHGHGADVVRMSQHAPQGVSKKVAARTETQILANRPISVAGVRS